jgi:hypothetical protein
MKDYNNLLFNKNGLATVTLAKEFICCDEGKKIPTVTEFHEMTKLARGTIQNSLKSLQNADVITLEAHGHLGTILKHKDLKALLHIANIKFICGVMPLPYSKRYEGLASGIVRSSENKYEVPCYLAFMKGSKQRLSMLLSGIYDYTILSGYAAEKYIKEFPEITIIKSFGEHSYLSSHAMIFADKKDEFLKDGMRIGIDKSSIDQQELTKKACKDFDVKYVVVNYSNIIELLNSGEIDAALWNKDILLDRQLDFNYQDVNTTNSNDTEAVMVSLKENDVINKLLIELINVELVTTIQHQVMKNQINPSY